ncbi:hypothetical protein, partial [Enterobacter hormaechei]
MCKLTGFIMGLTILLGVTARDAGAATLSEMRMVNASQKPWMVIICSRTSEIPQKGESCRFNLSMQHPFQLSLSVF